MDESEVARAVAYFEACDDLRLLHDVLRSIRPRAAAEVRKHERRGSRVPAPLTIPPAADPSTREEALRTVKGANDFGQLQALSRTIGRRVEALQESEP